MATKRTTRRSPAAKKTTPAPAPKPSDPSPKRKRLPDKRNHPLERGELRHPLFTGSQSVRSYHVLDDKEKAKLGRLDTPDNGVLKGKVTKDFASQLSILPHEWLAMLAVGRPVPHVSIDIDTGELVELIVIPTFQDRIEAARAAAPYFAAKKAPVRTDPNVNPDGAGGVMEVPVADSLEQWTDFAQASQAKLKEQVRE